MADIDPNLGSGNPGGDNPPAGNPPAGNPPAGSGGAGGGQDPPAGDGRKVYEENYVKKIRDEAAASRVELKELREKLKGIEEKDLTENQKITKRLQELEQENQKLSQRARQADLMTAASNAGARKPAIVARLIDDGVEGNDLEAALKQIKKDNPELFAPAAPGTADGGAGGSGKSNEHKSVDEAMNAQIRRLSGRN